MMEKLKRKPYENIRYTKKAAGVALVALKALSMPIKQQSCIILPPNKGQCVVEKILYKPVKAHIFVTWEKGM